MTNHRWLIGQERTAHRGAMTYVRYLRGSRHGRHAAVSLWLNAGVPATQVAEWAGHSVNVLLRVYATCIVGQDEAARHRIQAMLDASAPGADHPWPTAQSPELRHYFGTDSLRTPIPAIHDRTQPKGP